jgi:hypothetical protein
LRLFSGHAEKQASPQTNAQTNVDDTREGARGERNAKLCRLADLLWFIGDVGIEELENLLGKE